MTNESSFQALEPAAVHMAIMHKTLKILGHCCA